MSGYGRGQAHRARDAARGRLGERSQLARSYLVPRAPHAAHRAPQRHPGLCLTGKMIVEDEAAEPNLRYVNMSNICVRALRDSGSSPATSIVKNNIYSSVCSLVGPASAHLRVLTYRHSTSGGSSSSYYKTRVHLRLTLESVRLSGQMMDKHLTP
ncbi:hypothetical protein EVAR_48508_1 [Eumeta japonica]|uniref:Uncharacterized protein n=1 Tax=Eumeta variegata TaxID=151549 RepID=A0A4C1Z2R8_EUMVA|nr:hypothetical protein EVAR_48508_1 [Eumeta japonica]